MAKSVWHNDCELCSDVCDHAPVKPIEICNGYHSTDANMCLQIYLWHKRCTPTQFCVGIQSRWYVNVNIYSIKEIERAYTAPFRHPSLTYKWHPSFHKEWSIYFSVTCSKKCLRSFNLQCEAPEGGNPELRPVASRSRSRRQPRRSWYTYRNWFLYTWVKKRLYENYFKLKTNCDLHFG